MEVPISTSEQGQSRPPDRPRRSKLKFRHSSRPARPLLSAARAAPPYASPLAGGPSVAAPACNADKLSGMGAAVPTASSLIFVSVMPRLSKPTLHVAANVLAHGCRSNQTRMSQRRCQNAVVHPSGMVNPSPYTMNYCDRVRSGCREDFVSASAADDRSKAATLDTCPGSERSRTDDRIRGLHAQIHLRSGGITHRLHGARSTPCRAG